MLFSKFPINKTIEVDITNKGNSNSHDAVYYTSLFNIKNMHSYTIFNYSGNTYCVLMGCLFIVYKKNKSSFIYSYSNFENFYELLFVPVIITTFNKDYSATLLKLLAVKSRYTDSSFYKNSSFLIKRNINIEYKSNIIVKKFIEAQNNYDCSYNTTFLKECEINSFLIKNKTFKEVSTFVELKNIKEKLLDTWFSSIYYDLKLEGELEEEIIDSLPF